MRRQAAERPDRRRRCVALGFAAEQGQPGGGAVRQARYRAELKFDVQRIAAGAAARVAVHLLDVVQGVVVVELTRLDVMEEFQARIAPIDLAHVELCREVLGIRMRGKTQDPVVGVHDLDQRSAGAEQAGDVLQRAAPGRIAQGGLIETPDNGVVLISSQHLPRPSAPAREATLV
jgi:hypothetical protein